MPRGNSRNGDTDGSNYRNRQTKDGYKVHRSAEFSGWVNASIPDANRADFEEFETSSRCIEAFDAIGKSHIRTSVVFDLKDQCYTANAFHMDEAHPSGGLMVSARSTTALRALMKLLYLIIEVMPEDWTELISRAKSDW